MKILEIKFINQALNLLYWGKGSQKKPFSIGMPKGTGVGKSASKFESQLRQRQAGNSESSVQQASKQERKGYWWSGTRHKTRESSLSIHSKVG